MSTPSTSAPSFASGSAVVPSPHPTSRSALNANAIHERFTALAHRGRDAREIAFLPECFVWISRSIHDVSLSVGFVWSQLVASRQTSWERNDRSTRAGEFDVLAYRELADHITSSHAELVAGTSYRCSLGSQ